MGLVIAGERSGVGKTTITVALLAYLKKQGLQVQSFKVGPDYIDPMFHQYVTERPCRTLDPVLTSERYVQHCFAHHSQTVDSVLVEGVMGLFDGAPQQIQASKGIDNGSLVENLVGGFGSTAHIARLLNLPVLLVVDCSRLSHSIAAIVQGYCSLDPQLQVAGVVLNRVGSDRHLHLLQSAIEPLNIPILGILHRQDDLTIPDRHLGLIPTAELSNLQALMDQFAHQAEEWFDWQQLMPLLNQSFCLTENLEVRDGENFKDLNVKTPIRIAIAQDAAFSFYYQDNLDLLTHLGADLIPWSPLKDKALPDNVQGLYLGGGFPEMFAPQLAANESMRESVRTAILAGMPTYAECGGLMYLCEKIVDFQADCWEMVGILPTTASMGKRLTLGYRKATALEDGVLLQKGAIAWGHEFHRSHANTESPNPLFGVDPQNSLNQQSGTSEGWWLPNLHASYIHLHWGATPEFPKHFVDQCKHYSP